MHAATLAANRVFLDGLVAAATRGAAIYGECGGYMVLGETLTDAEGVEQPMAGLLTLATSFAEPPSASNDRASWSSVACPCSSFDTLPWLVWRILATRS